MPLPIVPAYVLSADTTDMYVCKCSFALFTLIIALLFINGLGSDSTHCYLCLSEGF